MIVEAYVQLVWMWLFVSFVGAIAIAASDGARAPSRQLASPSS